MQNLKLPLQNYKQRWHSDLLLVTERCLFRFHHSSAVCARNIVIFVLILRGGSIVVALCSERRRLRLDVRLGQGLLAKVALVGTKWTHFFQQLTTDFSIFFSFKCKVMKLIKISRQDISNSRAVKHETLHPTVLPHKAAPKRGYWFPAITCCCNLQ